ncbi:MAG: hypothetical protein LBC42_02355 [Puniceicoccales bacterium]|nr:hypothetical protein [Puniceicoccales bacterium]
MTPSASSTAPPPSALGEPRSLDVLNRAITVVTEIGELDPEVKKNLSGFLGDTLMAFLEWLATIWSSNGSSEPSEENPHPVAMPAAVVIDHNAVDELFEKLKGKLTEVTRPIYPAEQALVTSLRSELKTRPKTNLAILRTVCVLQTVHISASDIPHAFSEENKTHFSAMENLHAYLAIMKLDEERKCVTVDQTPDGSLIVTAHEYDPNNLPAIGSHGGIFFV